MTTIEKIKLSQKIEIDKINRFISSNNLINCYPLSLFDFLEDNPYYDTLTKEYIAKTKERYKTPYDYIMTEREANPQAIFINQFDIKNKGIINQVSYKTNTDAIRIYARKTKAVIISKKQANEFLQYNHGQGARSSGQGTINIGLIDNSDNLLEVMTFGNKRGGRKTKIKGNYELKRLATQKGIAVAGGASKLLKFALKEFEVLRKGIYSYQNLTRNYGNTYEILGMTLAEIDKGGMPFFYNLNTGERGHLQNIQNNSVAELYAGEIVKGHIGANYTWILSAEKINAELV